MIASTLKKLAIRVSSTRPFELVLRQMESRNRRHLQLRVLAWHRIDERSPEDSYYPGLISASPEQFSHQIRAIAERYTVCSMQDVIDASQQNTSLPGNAVVLTFDDATVDFLKYAWPILKQAGVPATVFVPTAYPDNHTLHFWWDRLYRAILQSGDGTVLPLSSGTVCLSTPQQRKQLFRQLKEHLKVIPHPDAQDLLDKIAKAAAVSDPVHNNVLSWDQLRLLKKDGVTLAPHTHTHPMLNQLTTQEVAQEVRVSREVLSAQTGSDCASLAYPAGGVNSEVVSTIAREGFDLAFSTQRGVNDQSFHERFLLRRINVGAATTPGLLRMQLANWGR